VHGTETKKNKEKLKTKKTISSEETVQAKVNEAVREEEVNYGE